MNYAATEIRPSYIFQRAIAGVIDYLLMAGVFVAIVFTLGQPDGHGGYAAGGDGLILLIFCWFLLLPGLEQIMGATIGNGIMGLKPVTLIRNQKPDSIQSVKRHLVDLIDMFFFGVVAYIAIKSTPKHQRLGDLWAGTIVVKE